MNWRIVKLSIVFTIEKRIHEAKPEFTNVELTLVIHLSWFCRNMSYLFLLWNTKKTVPSRHDDEVRFSHHETFWHRCDGCINLKRWTCSRGRKSVSHALIISRSRGHLTATHHDTCNTDAFTSVHESACLLHIVTRHLLQVNIRNVQKSRPTVAPTGLCVTTQHTKHSVRNEGQLWLCGEKLVLSIFNQPEVYLVGFFFSNFCGH